jgi:RNA polymerase sigma-70 factor (ECF subfamily)
MWWKEHGMSDLSDEASDEWLVQQIRCGDQDAFAQLFYRYNQPISKFLWSIVRNYADVQDLSQQTFIKVHKKLPTLARGASFERWLYRIAENTARDHLRASLRRPFFSQESLDENHREWDATFEDSVERAILFKQIQETVQKKITQKQATCFTLRIQGIEPAEIARRLHLSEGTVRTYLSKVFLLAREEYLQLIRQEC